MGLKKVLQQHFIIAAMQHNRKHNISSVLKVTHLGVSINLIVLIVLIYILINQAHIKLRKLLKPVSMKLSSDELLSKCLRGKTRNNNESLIIIWKRCPKDICVGRTTLTMGATFAVISFNDGACGI